MVGSSKFILWPSHLCVFPKRSQRDKDGQRLSPDIPARVSAPSRESQSCLFFTHHKPKSYKTKRNVPSCFSDCFCRLQRRLHTISRLAVHHTITHETRSAKDRSKVCCLFFIVTLVLLGLSTQLRKW